MECVGVLVKVKPTYGPILVVEKLDAVMNWKEFFGAWNCSFSGHTQTKAQTDAGMKAPHVFKFVLRQDLLPGQSVESSFGDAPHAADVILLTKQYLGSTELSQPATVCVPWSMHDKVAVEGPTKVAERITYSERVAKEFRKTAKLVAGPPYRMDRTAAYLTSLLESASGTAPDISWVQQAGRSEELVLIEPRPSAMSLDFLVADPAPVRVGPQPCKQAKRAATADGSPGVVAGRMAVSTVKRQRLGLLPKDMRGKKLGCGKCRTDEIKGCSQCRRKLGLVENGDGSWRWNDGDNAPQVDGHSPDHGSARLNGPELCLDFPPCSASNRM